MLDVQPSPSHIATLGNVASAPKQMKSDALFEGAREIRIDHHGQEYRLRQTRNGKLILTK
jgi:hemin uptake protein HemP